jgi:hypothetical protein
MATDFATQLIAQDRVRREAPRGLGREGVVEITRELRHLLADVFTLYLKTKSSEAWLRALVHIVISGPENEIDCGGRQSLELGIAFMLTDSCQPTI